MAKNPAARFGSASGLAEAAARALHDPTFRGPLPPIPSREVGPYPVQSPAAAPWWQHSGQGTMAPGDGPRLGKRRRRGAIGAAIAAVVLVAATVTVAAWPDGTTSGPADATRGGSATGSTPGPPSLQGPPATDIAGPQLRPILLTTAEVAGASNGDVVALENDSPTLLDDAATVDNRQCVGAWAPAQQSVYGATDYTGVAAQLLRALNQAAWQDSVTQAVVAFPSQESAGKSYVNQRGQWALCGGKALTVTTAGQPTQTWDLAQPVTTSGVLTLVATLRGGAASCQRGMLVRGNVIIDIRQCQPGNTNVTALVTATAGKVPHQ
jgi:hypothetical protein